MSADDLIKTLGSQNSGKALYDFVAELYPLCRSITGEGVRETLRLVQKRIPLDIHEVASGTQVFDWTVPLEWNIRDAYVKNRAGERVIDFQVSNLHVVNYSQPIRKLMKLEELKPHLHTLHEHPDWVPYRTSYYKADWGFCLSQKQLSQMVDEEYEVCIDSSLTQGTLTYGECYLPGASTDEVLISCHVCHPSLCNDNLSGIVVATFLALNLAEQDRRYSYRLLFIPGTIGSITWLATHEQVIPRIKHGFVLTGIGDAGPLTYKRSRRGDAEIDHVMAQVLKQAGEPYKLIDFFPYGYDERQYCSPGFNLPVGCLMRTPHGEYPEYHTSADSLDFIKPQSLVGSLRHCLAVINVLEHNHRYMNQNPKCEPQLGKRGLYRAVAGHQATQSRELVLLWVLNLSDGMHSLLDIAERANVPFAEVQSAAAALVESGLLAKCEETVDHSQHGGCHE
jgi:aminopeptidase-like protein